MYLTRFELNLTRRGTQHLLSSPQRVHAAVLACYPTAEREPTDAGRILWRVDQANLYILSPHVPDLTGMAEQAGWPTKTTWQTRDYTPLLNRLALGDTWSFRLTANPVRSTVLKEGKRSQRVGHVTATQQQTWLLDRVEQWGFTIPVGSHKEPELLLRDRRIWNFDRAGRKVTLSTVVFDGRLTVTDPAALRTALTHGMGSAKGYGCGLLTLAR
ncbi:type I-E CRISPR-associated protein Cas6/Cse3/CasE [Actinokineospora globicatena]|uniref:Type I-E CRISPR-associated protein Cas6/Cse3/CasE n=1 Tax=Actinokineospora globicatena TaxID=103729 RepID=A0A9W6V794_9PSEU|nr:type I-E CRISPR-associated protein Cas6/Cse3/CasE [Actinokineospora globicatena]GLW89749.1 type I-E CRISPR-associated protein Cas6/Cse3/CasE [Actinokineospora globicatena]